MTGPFDLARDRLHGLEVAGRGDREAGLDHVHAEARELVGDLELFLPVQRDARRLLAVAQGRVEDQDAVGRRCCCCWMLVLMSFVLLLYLACASSLLGLRLRGRHALFPPRGEQKKREKRDCGTTSCMRRRSTAPRRGVPGGAQGVSTTLPTLRRSMIIVCAAPASLEAERAGDDRLDGAVVEHLAAAARSTARACRGPSTASACSARSRPSIRTSA